MKRALIGLVTFALSASLSSAETKKCTIDELISNADKMRQELFASDIKSNIIDNRKAFLVNEIFDGRDGTEIDGFVFYVTEFDENNCNYRTAHIGKEVFARYNFIWNLADQEKTCIAALNITKEDARGDITILDYQYGLLKFMNGDLLEFRSYDLDDERKVIPKFSAKFDSVKFADVNIDKLIERIELLDNNYKNKDGVSFYITSELELAMEIIGVGDYLDSSNKFGVYSSDTTRLIIIQGKNNLRSEVEIGVRGKYHYAGYAAFDNNLMRKEMNIIKEGVDKQRVENLLNSVLNQKREYPLFFESINSEGQEKI